MCKMYVYNYENINLNVPFSADTDVLDWSHQNLIAVALNQDTYVWNVESKASLMIPSQSLPGVSPLSRYMTALSWSPSLDKTLAMADDKGYMTVWDTVVFWLGFETLLDGDWVVYNILIDYKLMIELYKTFS